MKKTVFNIIVISLIAFSFIGCATQSNRAEVWRDVAPPNDFIGKWEGSVIQSIPKNDENAMPQTSLKITLSYEYIRGAAGVNGYMKVDLTQLITDWSNSEVMKSAGVTKEYLWEVLVGEFRKDGTFTVGGEYFVTQDISENVDEFFPEESERLQINGSGNKIKMIFPEPMSLGMGESGVTEMILDRK